MLAAFFRVSLITLVKLLVGASPRWVGCAPSANQRIYFSNHTSHLDTLAMWTAIPSEFRAKTRAVAAKDYWGAGVVKRYIAKQILNAVLIERELASRQDDPLAPLVDALAQGDSLMLFPEGTRKAQPLPDSFKSGLYYLAEKMPHIELVPVYLDTLHRSMPKGSWVPVPLVCTVRFGAPLLRLQNEHKKDFLTRARESVIYLSQQQKV